MALKKSKSKLWVARMGAVIGALFLLLAAESGWTAPCDIRNNAPPFIQHDLTVSYCELCGYGYVTIIISNPYDGAKMTDMTVVEDLRSTGLTFDPTAPDPMRVNGASQGSDAYPTISGSTLTWDRDQIDELADLQPRQGNNYDTLTITFAVTRASDPEGLVAVTDRRIEAQLTFSTDPTCSASSASTGLDTLDLREPDPALDKRGRNVDASQGNWTDRVFGHVNDDIIWRIRVRNNGDADLQDLRFDDVMENGSLEINYICPDYSSASQIAVANNGSGPAPGCVSADNTTYDFDVDNPFGDPGNDSPDLVDVEQGDNAYIYLVGKITESPNGSCEDHRTNTASDIQWGCEGEGAAGGIDETSDGDRPGIATATLYTRYGDRDRLSVVRRLTGTNTSQPVGSKGTMTIILRNYTGGSIKNIELADVLPTEYVMDPTFEPTVNIDPRYDSYPGMIDTITWTNEQPDPLANTAPEFILTSSSVHPIYSDQRDMMRDGDELTIVFRVVLIEPAYYDKVADIDVREENVSDGTDPDNRTTLTNDLTVEFDTFCSGQGHQTLFFNDTDIEAFPEDLDVDIAGNELVFILTGDPDQRLPLTVNLTNNGGHDAADYFAYVAFGQTMEVVSVPGDCAITTNPPPHQEWQLPAGIPPGASVYQCTGAPISPGRTVPLRFEVIKSESPADQEADDLTFRADTVGEITLSDGTPLWFPAPINPRADGGTDEANNYSLDGIRARVVGFNLLKSQVGTCSENNPPPTLPDLEVQIGEECTYHIETGGWFGFQTPGFTYIAVQDIQVFDQLPDGQGYISSTDPYPTSTSAIQGIRLNPAGLAPLDEVAAPEWMNWTFNQIVPDERITERDHWFRADMTSRLLNDPIDISAPPNQHAAPSVNTLTSYFQAVFYNDIKNQEEIYDLGPATVGYPRVEVRRIELTVTEPNITVVKEVCNESLYGTGTGCANFVPQADDGDAYNSYIYRLTLTNDASSSGVQHAPAYDITVTDRLDESDLAYVLPFASDGLDNDGDRLIGGADADEGAVSNNTVKDGVPAEITFSHTHSNALLRIDPGQSVRLYYRVDYDDDAAPLQTFTNTADAVYDSLEGVSGHQSAPQRPNSDKGGARVYTSQPDSAVVRIIPVETQPKTIAALSQTPLAVSPGTQDVSIGEEIEYRLNTLLPVALLRDFVIRDELPAGLRCSEAPVVDLDEWPYSVAKFKPGGEIVPTCSGNVVEWVFGDQRVTQGTVGNRYNFEIAFIAGVENTAATNDGDVLSNGGQATNATAHYIDETGEPVVLNFGQVDVRVREPRIELTKTFAKAEADAGDILTVTVTAANAGTATAYNLRVLDDLDGRNLTFLGNVGGADPPDTIDTTMGANRPIFSWDPPNGIAPGADISFTFDVRVDDVVQPHEVLDNTIQADWTSLPGQTTALNSTGTIGTDGSESGMRIGALPNAGDAVNDYETDDDAQAEVPAVTLSKTDLDPAVTPTIGVHKVFQLDIRMPEGVIDGVIAADSLNAAGVSYLLANNAEFDITYSFEGIATINGRTPDEAAFNAFPADGTSDRAVWDIGTVVTHTENDPNQSSIDPLIRIRYYGRVNNDLATNSGDTLQNSVVANYINGESGAQEALTDATAAVIVVEPVLAVLKTVSNATTGKQPDDPAGGGDLLEYVITIANSGSATAHDVNVVDTLPAQLSFYNGFTPKATIDGLPADGFVPIPANAPDGPLVWGKDNGDNSLDIPPGRSLVLTYRAVVQEAVGELGNSVWVDWTSLDDVSSYERTGAGCPDWTAPNDYCTGPATAITPTVDDTGFLKTIAADSYDVPPLSSATDAIARVGDTITYRLALNLRGGLTRAVQVQDVLPEGMAFVDIVSINGDATAAYTPPASGPGSNFAYAPIDATDVPAAGQTGTLTWTIGDVVNDPFGDPTTDILEILYRASILPNAGIAHVPSTTLTNTASLSYSGAAPLTSNAAVTLYQPVIDRVTKTDRSGRTSPAAVNVATDIMRFRLEVCNNGQAPAYSIELTDQLASQLDENSIANLAVSVGGVVLSAASDYVYSPPATRGGVMRFLLNTPVNPGQCLTIDYDIGFHTDFGHNQVWNNSASVDAYWSLPSQSGQRYGPVEPAIFTMHNVTTIEPPDKTIVPPAFAEATIGQEIVYHITVPGTLVNGAMFDVVITDTLDANLELIDVAEISGNNFTLINNSVPPGQVSLSIDQIPAGSQAVIELRARLRNIDSANAGVSFTNTALYTFASSPGGTSQGGGSDTTAPIRIVEPSLNLTKTVVNVTNPGVAPVAGDILRYSLAFSAAGGAAGDDFSDAFDLRIDDSLSLGLAFNGNATVSGAGNSIGDPVVSGDGSTTAQTLLWSLEDGNADITVIEGTTVSVSYDVRVLDGVLANQNLSNSATVQWTGIDGASVHERNGTGTPAWNDYFSAPVTTTLTTHDTNTIDKTRLLDTFGADDADVRVGDILEYELRLNLQEGTHPDVVLTDTLPQGLIFEGVVGINGDSTAPYAAVAPFVHADIPNTAIVVAGDPITGPSTITWTLGSIVNRADDEPANDAFVIIYRARVLNEVHPHLNAISLTNSVTMDYETATGPAPSKRDAETVTLLQPNLTVAKSAEAGGGDRVLAADEIVTYTVDIRNTGSAPAYDTLVEDIIPVGMRNGAATITMVGVQLLSGAVLPNLAPVYNAVTGIATWNFDTGIADQYTIPAGDTLRIVYQVQAEAAIGAGLTLTNQAQVRRYYSFDDEAAAALGGVTGVREIYGPSNVAGTTFTTATPGALVKDNPAVSTVAVGEPFTYRITVPEVPQAAALYDVRILDDLSASAADLSFVSVAKVSGSQPWAPVNTGSATILVIEDTTVGIDIPAGEQIVIDITVVLDDTPTNISGLQFNNTAAYTYDSIDNNPATRASGGSDTTGNLTIVGPDALTLEKSGSTTLQVGTPATYILNVHNPSSGTAWNPIIADRLPHGATGGLCEAGPSNVTARIFESDGVTPASPPLVQGTDFEVNFDGEPTCEWQIRLLPPAGGLAPNRRLIVRYDVELDPSTENGIALTNVAGVLQWLSTNPETPNAAPRTYNRQLTDGTPGTLDHEDSHTATCEAPVLRFIKSVQNVTTGQNPGSNASPGDTLRYTLQISNSGPIGLTSFSIVDEVDRLNTVPAFAPGSLNLISVPAGADISGTSATGGMQGTGLVNVADLSIGALGETHDTVEIVFEITLAPVITSGTLVLNQAELVAANLDLLVSDDPSVAGDTDPTETLIASAPAFEVQKISTIMSGDPNILMAGETLRYTITIKNIGNEDAVNVRLQDDTPAHTTYVPNSATLNGIVVGDPMPGLNPLQAGILINAPENTTPGYLRADAAPGATNVATVSFSVVVDPRAMNGLIIENQGFVSGSGTGSGLQPEQPSDDPATPAPDDPTRNIVGNLPLLYAHKTVRIHADFGSPGIVDPGDVLRYSIVINNFGAIPATGVVLTDDVPTHTTYVADSLRLNGAPIGPDGGVSPLIAGLSVQSSDNPGTGILSAAASAVITFEARVNAGAPTGTLIRNQGSLSSNELPPQLTDADGLPSNGYQPTVIVVGDVQLLSITKEVQVVGGGAALAGGQLEYIIRATNIGSLSATGVVVSDDLGPPLGDQVSYVAGSGALNGSASGVTYAGTILTADYASQYGDLQPGSSAVLRFRVQIASTLAIGTTITNTADVRWSDPPQTASDSVSIDVGGTPGSASLNGNVWHDANLDRIRSDGSETGMAGWSVELYRNDQLITTVLTDADGVYQIRGLVPNDGTADLYELRFHAAGAGPNTASLGTADSPFTNGPQRISAIIVASGDNLQNLNLPLWPNGAVYDSIAREPVAGARLALLNAATGAALPTRCLDDPAQQNQVTTLNGFYKFDLNFSDEACPAGGAYLIEVQSPMSGYLAAPSRIIPPASDATTAPFDIPACPGSSEDAVPATAEICEVTTFPAIPPPSVLPGTAGTVYHLHLVLDDGLLPGYSQVFNNPIALDPELDGAVAITKTSSMINVSRGALVPYTITVSNVFGAPLYDIRIVDRFPAGFKYVAGSARLDGRPVEPQINGRELAWDGLQLQVNQKYTIQLLLAVGSGVSEGEYVNRAQVINTAVNAPASGEATATVRVVPDPDFDCTDVIGKVFDDRNLNGHQDKSEKGLAGVRVVTVRGLIATTDKHGRFHITCAAVPDQDRGSNFILKLDERSLPTGYRLTTENPRVQRATRGKMIRFSFGATIHRVVRIDIAGGVFEPNTSQLRLQWRPRIDRLLAELKKAPSILRLAYLADVEREGLVQQRLKALRKEISRQWNQSEGGYRLTIETEVFWRRGAPLAGQP